MALPFHGLEKWGWSVDPPPNGFSAFREQNACLRESTQWLLILRTSFKRKSLWIRRLVGGSCLLFLRKVAGAQTIHVYWCMVYHISVLCVCFLLERYIYILIVTPTCKYKNLPSACRAYLQEDRKRAMYFFCWLYTMNWPEGAWKINCPDIWYVGFVGLSNPIIGGHRDYAISQEKKRVYLEPVILKCIELWPLCTPWWFAVHTGDDSFYPLIIVWDYFIPALVFHRKKHEPIRMTHGMPEI